MWVFGGLTLLVKIINCRLKIQKKYFGEFSKHNEDGEVFFSKTLNIYE